MEVLLSPNLRIKISDISGIYIRKHLPDLWPAFD